MSDGLGPPYYLYYYCASLRPPPRHGAAEAERLGDVQAADLPPRPWLGELFARGALTSTDRLMLLAGRAGAVADVGTMICACHGVSQRAIESAIGGGARSVEALGTTLKAGTNCGSCVPELKNLLACAPAAAVATAPPD